MINSDLHLHSSIFDRDKIPRAGMRDAIDEALLALAEKDDRVVALSADVSESVRLDGFKKKYPERYIEVGVAEQNLAGVASGLANYGKIPYIATFAVFSPGRNWEQIRTTIALSELPVKIIGTHTGVGVGADGATHQALEDITLMRVLPHMELIVPMDKEEARKAIIASHRSDKPTYIRITRHETSLCTTPDTPFEIGKADYLWHSKKASVAIIGAGPLLYDALHVAQRLEQEGIGSSVLNVHTVRPMDVERVKEAARNAGAVVTLEEHQILGGVGGTIAEVLVQNDPVPVEMVAVHDRFGQSGKASELLHEYKLDEQAIYEAAKRVLARKR